MKTVTLLTATRAEYGLLSPIIRALKQSEELEVRVVVTGAHLSPEFGCTYRDIEAEGVSIDAKIDGLLSSDTPAAISKSMAVTLMGFADYFKVRRPDALLVLGDRYETLAVCCAAMNEMIPIIHLYGGETTEGAVDEAIRHSITKMSYLHLTSTEAYRRRVIQMGENPERVFTVGSIGVENVLKQHLLTREELGESLGIELSEPYALVTFHPVTLEARDAACQFKALLDAFDAAPDRNYIFTYANADSGGRIINQMIEEYAAGHGNAFAFESLGTVRYLSAVKYAQMVIGNSSSGLVEVPSFGIPTINIGNRQRGRIKAESVIDCPPEREAISEAMAKAEEPAFREMCRYVKNPYGDGDTSGKIVRAILDTMRGEVDLKKKFYDIEVRDEKSGNYPSPQRV